MLRSLISGVFLLVLALPPVGAQEFEARYHGADSAMAGSSRATQGLEDFVRIVFDAGLHDLAVAAIESHLARHPLDAEAQLMAARIHQRLGHDEQAVQYAEQALQSGRLDDTQLRRAAFLRAELKGSSEIPTPKVANLLREAAPDPLATAGVSRISRDRLSPANHAELDEVVLRRIYGDVAQSSADPVARIATIAPAQAKSPLPPVAAARSGDLQEASESAERTTENVLAYQDDGVVPATVQPVIDLSLRYTFSLY